MLVAFVAKDKPDHLATRLANRDAHVAYLKSSGCVHMAGPLLDDGGDMCGSLIILDVADMDQAASWVADDPYGKAGLFAETTLIQWNKVLG